MDLGRALISKIIDDNDLASAQRSGVRPNWFEDEDHRKVYQWMLDYYSRYSEVPTEVALKAEFPNFRMASTLEPYEYYTDKFRAQRKRSILMDSIIEANTAADDEDTKRAQEILSQGLLQIGKEVSVLTDSNAPIDWKDRYGAYVEAAEHAGELTGIPTGVPTLDYVTGGYHDGQFVLFGGAPKQCKSFMLMQSAIAAHDHGCHVLFLSFEMSAFEQLVRYDAMCCGINSSTLLHGVLPIDEMKRLRKGMALRRNMNPFIISSDTSASTTVSGLSAKIDEHKPDIIFVDGVYLMDNEVGANDGSSQAYTAISRGLKRLAQRAEIPLVGTTQALSSKMGKDAAVTLHSLGWSSAWGQDADLVVGVEKLAETHLVKMRIVAGRQVAPREIGIACNWDETSFSETDIDRGDDE